jgi:putative glutamine amidotransferase
VVNAYFGGTLVKIENHVKAKHKISGKMESEVVCFHNNGIKILGKNLIETFQSSDKNIEGFEHEIYPITGLMWHPERNTPLSSSMLKYLSERLVNKH